MTLRMVVLARAAVALAAVSLVAGCSDGGAGGGSPSASATGPANEAAAMRAVSTCMRANGYPGFPDPVQESDGTWGWPDVPGLPDRTANTACDDLTVRAKTLANKKDQERAVSAADIAKLRRYAVCVRQHGVADWPDPSPRGDFRVPTRLQPPQGEAVVSEAHEACESMLGGAEVRIAAPGDEGGK